MKFSTKRINLKKESNVCIIISVFEKQQLTLSGKKIDDISGGYISSILEWSNFTGKIGQKLFLYDIPNFLYKHILLIGCGKNLILKDKEYKKIIRQLNGSLQNVNFAKTICFLDELNVIDRNRYWKIRQIIETIHESLYNFQQFKTKNKKSDYKLNELIFQEPKEESLRKETLLAIHHGYIIGKNIKLTKDLANTPPNICNPVYLMNKVKEMAAKYKNKISIQFIDEEEMQNLGMTAYLAVGQGSNNETLMSIIKYQGNSDPNHQPIVFIGKGVTFDSGGISIKPSDKLDEMKYDMCGAATTYSILNLAAELNLPLNIIGILATCENMINGNSLRPGDILSSLSGKTIEIINTDAEGRLILCDVLTYIERFKPETVIDIATLTGACIIALGHHYTALMTNFQPLANELILASRQSGDKVWQLPLATEFQKQLQSNCADIANIGDKTAGAITAGCFLAEFTNKYHWVHLDIAGTAWIPQPNKNATGRPVALLAQFLINRSKLIEEKTQKI
ncbi:leucyl aminopeptidase [Blochmannia endosymbiont of Colobopsis nipponica]|uniref:leucyl aminopeptidase n=1 Tax=Blochmannia endosymbiont of Colobopsis nipponica TaxID=2681987 RepID=UPI00177A9632|nr:leucyl aminopeptidase [Blochmannia endosymbiont of Colobopsis nipponica]QOI10812.1 leucyl aminopeptidase [Blochmannia endosymbiont of Colobopsis nipponica]